MIHLDTNFLISSLRAGSIEQQKMLGWLSASEPVNLSAVAWAEFLAGPLTANDETVARSLFTQPEPLLAADAEFAAKLFNQTGRRSRSLADCMIAAVAIRCSAPLATLNNTDFSLFVPHGLRFI